MLDEINKENNTAYKESDVYMQFDRVVPTNELDNANIELIEANKRNVEITTLLNVATKLDDETLLKNICNVLDIDYEEIKDKLPEAVPSVAEATQTLLES